MEHKDYNELEFLEYMKTKKKRLVKKWRKEQTLKTYITNLKTFFNFYTTKELSDLNSEDILNYKKYLKNEKYSDGTINVKLSSVAQLIKYLNNSKGYKLYNIRIEKIDIPKKVYLERVITREEFAIIQEKCRRKSDIRSLAIFNMLYYTGARISELEQIELRHIKEMKCNVKGKGDVSRYLYLSNPLLQRTLNAYIKVREHNSLSFFTGEKGSLTVRRIQQLWSKYCKETGLEGVGIHTLRHLYSLEFMKTNNNDIHELQKRLGHKHSSTTEIYIVKKEDKIREQIAKIR